MKNIFCYVLDARYPCIRFGGGRTIKDPRKEIGPGLLATILRRLGVDRKTL